MKVLVLDDRHGFREEIPGMLSKRRHEGVGVDNAAAATTLRDLRARGDPSLALCMGAA